MSPNQFRAAVKRLQLPLAEIARRLRVHVRTVRRWAAGESAVPETVALLLECWVRDGVPAQVDHAAPRRLASHPSTSV